MHGRLCCPSPTLKANAGQHSVHAHVTANNKNRQIMKNLLAIFLTILTVTVFGQVDATIWDSLKTVTTDNYQ